MKPIMPALLALSLLATSGAALAQSWLRVSDTSLARQEIYPTALDGKIYVAGGILSAAPGFTDLFESYDAATDRWTRLAALPEGRHHIALAEAGGKIYGIGGFSGAIPDWRAHASVFVYDPKADRWSSGPSLPQARAEGVVATIGEKIYFVGGRIPTGAGAKHISEHADTSRAEVLDLRSGGWTPIADAPSARNSAAGAVIGNKLYVVGGRQMVVQADGRSRPVNVATLEVYDPATDRWETRAPMPLAQGGLAAAAHDGKLYVFGGEQFVPQAKVFGESWVYDPALDRWSALPGMATPRHGHGAAVVGNRIYLMGGGVKVGVAASAVHEAFEIPTR